MCHMYRDTGTCRFGAKCKFTHGRNDIRKKLAKEGINANGTAKVPEGVCKWFFEKGLCKRFKTECPNSHPKGEKSGELGPEKGLIWTKPEGWKMDEVETNGHSEAMDVEAKPAAAKKKPGPKSKTTEAAAKKAPKKMGPKSKTMVKEGDEAGATESTAEKPKKVHPPKGVCRFFFKFGKCERKKSACPMEHPNGKKTGEFSYVKEDTEKEEETKDLELLDEPTENAEEKTEDVDMQILDDEETPKE